MSLTQVSPEYLAQSKGPMLNVLYAVPIPLEILSTGLRLWVKVSPHSDGRLCADDIIITLATVRDSSSFELLVESSLLYSS